MRKSGPPRAFADIADLPEAERIKMIGDTAAAGDVVGFFVDDHAKADSYIAQLRAFPIQILGRTDGPGGTVLVRVGPLVPGMSIN